MDINPDQAVILGAFGSKHPLVLALDWLNRRILKRADSVIALDRFMAERMEHKLKHPDTGLRRPIAIIPPWPMDDYLEPVEHADNPFRKQHGWDDTFVVMYSGNHSLVHPLDTILAAAARLRNDPRFVFAFIGGGKGKAVIDARLQAEANDSRNLISLPYQPLEQIRYSLSAADLHLVSLGDNMSGIVHPCKIYGALSIGRPVLTLGPKESYLSDIIEPDPASASSHQSSLAAPVGWAIQHGDVDGAVAALRAAADQTHEERIAIGQRAQQVTTEKFGREQLVQQFLDAILDD
jgi:glycosyltransferase involved in cell wall biosynthesis